MAFGPESESLLEEERTSPSKLTGFLFDPCNAPELKKVAGMRDLLTAVHFVSSAFFRDASAWSRAWSLTGLLAVMMLAVAATNVKYVTLTGDLQNALHDRDGDAFWVALRQLLILGCVHCPALALRDGFKGVFTLEWRRCLTKRLLAGYISDSQAYYRLKLAGTTLDNPDQRIGEDTGHFTRTVPTFFIISVQSLISIVTQSGLLLTLDASLFFLVLGYSILLNVFTCVVFGYRLTAIQRVVLGQEASFRFALVRVREHAEPIAFYQGATFERNRCEQFFFELLQHLYQKLFLTVTFEAFHQTTSLLMRVAPYAVVVHKYLAGDLDFGTMSEAVMVLLHLETNFNVLANHIEDITGMGAQAIRVRELFDAVEGMADSRREEPEKHGLIIAGRSGLRAAGAIELVECPCDPRQVLLRLDRITLQPPLGQVPLVTQLSLELRLGESALISGPSGVGKSSILRAIGGLWASGRGTIERCAASQAFFVPQEPYLCLGSLRENCTYPGNTFAGMQEPTDQEIQDALSSVNLGYLLERYSLERRVDLNTALSGGERQRLGFARLLLRPANLRFAIMDEATSALDEANEMIVYKLLRDKVQSYVSVGHRENLLGLHTHRLALECTASGVCSWRFDRTDDAQASATPVRFKMRAADAEANEKDPELQQPGPLTDSSERWSPL